MTLIHQKWNIAENRKTQQNNGTDTQRNDSGRDGNGIFGLMIYLRCLCQKND